MDYFFDGSKEALETLIAQAVRAAIDGRLPSSEVYAPTPQPQKKETAPTSATPPAASLLVAVCCSDCLNEATQKELDKIEQQQIKIHIEEADELEEAADIKSLIAPYPVTFFPALSENAIAKIANGIFDEPLGRLLLETLKQGKPLFAVAPGNCAEVSPNLFRLRQSHRQKLEQFGIRWVERKDISKVLLSALPKNTNSNASAAKNNSQKKLITAQDVDEAARQGRQKLQLPYRCIITPLAKDRARELKVVIELKG